MLDILDAIAGVVAEPMMFSKPWWEKYGSNYNNMTELARLKQERRNIGNWVTDKNRWVHPEQNS